MMLPMATWRELDLLYPVLTVRSPDGNTDETLSRREAYKLMDQGWTLIDGVAFDYMPNPPVSDDTAMLTIGDSNDAGDVIVVNEAGNAYRLLDDMAFSRTVSGDILGYYSRRSAYYFSGTATDTVIPVESVDTWVDAALTMDPLGLSDNRPLGMKEALAEPFDAATGKFSLEGAPTDSFGIFSPSFTFDPDEDGGELSFRLLFDHHSGVTPATSSVEDVVGTMNQGADEDYVFAPSLNFSVTSDMDTEGSGDAGKARLQIKSTVAGTASLRGIAYYLFA